MLFNQLGLSAELLRAVEKQGYSEATPIQREAIPPILELFSKAVMFWLVPKPARARQPALRCRYCSACSKTSQRNDSSGHLFSCPRVNSRLRLAKA